jgi:hypothetical protein
MSLIFLYFAALLEVLTKVWKYKSLKRLTSAERFVLALTIALAMVLVKQGVAL